MKAVTINDDKSLSYIEVGSISRKEGEIMIEVHAASINRADLLQREGSYPPPPGCPNWPGLEVAGTVYEVGENSKFRIGDKVCALLGGGGYAEYVSVDERMVLPMPRGLSYEEASAIPEVYATAFLNLFSIGEAKKGETLLLTAGNSGLASAIIPIAKDHGMRVITTVRGEAKAKAIEGLGADIIVDTTKESLPEVLNEEEKKGYPVDIAIDCLGGKDLGECLKYVARGCRWIQVATLAGNDSTIDFRNVYVRNIHLIGSTLRSKSPEKKGQVLSSLKESLWPKFESGEMKVNVCKVFPIEEVEKAHETLYKGEQVGKVVLKVR